MIAAAAGAVVDDHDVLGLLDRLVLSCVELLGATGAGLLLSDRRGEPQVVASSSEVVQAVELVQVEHRQGPGLECLHSGEAVAVTDLGSTRPGWPLFSVAASDARFRSVSTVPMRLRDETIGALDIYGVDVPLSTEGRRFARALADATTVALLQQRSARDASRLAEQLRHALSSRILIEQAKGILAERGRLSMDAAFASIRAYARNHNRRLSTVARSVVRRQVALDDVLAAASDER